MKELHNISREDILGLLNRGTSTGVLSLYVGIPASERHDSNRWLSGVRSGLTELQHRHPGNKELAGLVETAQQDIGKLPVETRRRSLVYFRSHSPDWVFWKSLHPYLPDQFTYTSAPQVSNLVSLLDESPRVGVAVVSQDHARVFTWKEGVATEHEQVALEPESIGPAPSPGHGISENRAEDRARRGLHQLAARIARAGDTHRWQKLLLSGSATTVKAIEEQLPETWRRQLIPSVDRNMIKAPLAEIADLAGQQVYAWKRQEELAEITALLDDSRAGGRADTSVEPSLDHLHKGRVEKLYVCADLELAGYSDPSGRLTMREPLNGDAGSVTKEPRLVEKMIVQAIESGAAIIPVEGESARKLALVGGVGARLRW